MSIFQNRKFRGGAYTTVLSVLVIALVLLVNLVVSGTVRPKDLTAEGMYSLNEVTEKYLKDYSTPVELVYFCENGKEEKVIRKTAENFAAKSKNITMTDRDPNTHPTLVFSYTGSNKMPNNSIVLVNRNDEDHFVYIPCEQMKQYYVNQKNLNSRELAGYCAEAEILKGIVKLSGETDVKVCVATGHREQVLTDEGVLNQTLANLMNLNAYTVSYADLKTQPVPSDCEALLLLGPIDDFSEEEYQNIRNYMTAGGRVMWFLVNTGYDNRPNQQNLLNYYGLKMEVGLLCEPDSRYTSDGHPESILRKFGNSNSLWRICTGVSEIEQPRNTLKVEPVISTSDKAYLCQDAKDYSYKPEYKSGKFHILTKVTDSFQGKTGTMYVFNTQYFLGDISNPSYANGEVFAECLGELCEKESSISIPITAAREEGLMMSSKTMRTLTVIIVGIVPGLILLAGIVMVFLRRR